MNLKYAPGRRRSRGTDHAGFGTGRGAVSVTADHARVPFAAGGPNDVMSRIVSEHMSRKLGQPIIVENVAGAGGTIGSTRVAKSTPDGYTLVSGHVGTHAASLALYPNLRYDPLADFTPMAWSRKRPILVVTRRDLAADSMASFIAIAKAARPGPDPGPCGRRFDRPHQLSAVHLRGRVQARGGALSRIGAGDDRPDRGPQRLQLRTAGGRASLPWRQPFAFSDRFSAARVPQLPDTPTARKQGSHSFVASSWFAFFLPKGVPDAIRDRFTDALRAALDDDSVRKRLELAGLILPPPDQRGPEPLKRRMIEEIARWQDIVKTAQIRPIRGSHLSLFVEPKQLRRIGHQNFLQLRLVRRVAIQQFQQIRIVGRLHDRTGCGQSLAHTQRSGAASI